MKPNSDPRHELLEDLFSPAENEENLPIEEVLGVIQRGKQTRARRRRVMALAGFGIVLVSAISGVWMSRPEVPAASFAQITPSTVAPVQPDLPRVERVSDQGALALLDSTPSAVIEWPDGRRTLMMVFSNRR